MVVRKKWTNPKPTLRRIYRLALVANRLVLYMDVELKFTNLKLAFAEAVGRLSRTLLVYSDVVHSNVVGVRSEIGRNATIA